MTAGRNGWAAITKGTLISTLAHRAIEPRPDLSVAADESARLGGDAELVRLLEVFGRFHMSELPEIGVALAALTPKRRELLRSVVATRPDLAIEFDEMSAIAEQEAYKRATRHVIRA